MPYVYFDNDQKKWCPDRRFAVDGNARSWKSANVARRPLSAGLRKSVRQGGRSLSPVDTDKRSLHDDMPARLAFDLITRRALAYIYPVDR